MSHALPHALPIALAALAGAAICWPIRPARYRLRHLTSHPIGGATEANRRWRQPWARLRDRLRITRRGHWRSGVLAGALTAGLLGLLVGGIGPGLALAFAVSTVHTRWRARKSALYQLSTAAALADAVRALAAELRTGAHPAAAAESVAAEVTEPAAAVLRTVAGAARLGGEVGAALRQSACELPTLAGVLRPLAQAWSLADRHGLPLADLLDTAGRDLDGRIRFAGQVRARMAGPKASAAVLAGLPVLGLLLGEGMGAQPVRVLLAPGAGQLLLALGVALGCAGIRWTARLTERSVLP